MDHDIHLHEDELTLLCYRELSEGEERRARAHLERCAACRASHDDLQRLLAMADDYVAPEPGEAFEAQVWRRLQPALRAVRRKERDGFGARLLDWFAVAPVRRWAAAGALASLVLAAFVAGRYSPAPPAHAPAVQADRGDAVSLRERVLLSALGDHFNRIEAVLVELASVKPAGGANISGEQLRATDLLAATRIYRRAALEAGDRTVADVLDTLERILVDVSASPAEPTPYELQALQGRIDKQELLFKLRIASTAVRDREKRTHAATLRDRAGA